jgi:hypothetical protein
MAIAFPHLNLLFWLGFGISLVGAAGAGWLGHSEIKKWTTAGYLIAVILAVDVVAPIAVLTYALWPERHSSDRRADITIKKIEVGHPGSNQETFILNYHYSDVGNAIGNSPYVSYAWKLFDNEPNEKEVEELYATAREQLAKAPKQTEIQNEVRPGGDLFNTIWNFGITNEQYTNIIAGNSWLTVLIIFHYMDQDGSRNARRRVPI